ncbi:MAG: glycosyl transferase [Verrucomicrobia bacterium]|nr:glycosyl transferase [Verrucomicrobiota bacterium]
MSLSAVTRRLGLGRLAYHGFHRPTGWLRDLCLDGGPWQRHRTEQGRRDMEAAAAQLPLLPTFPAAAPVTLHVLTGRRFWYQTAFCLWSFARAAQRPVAPVILDDGSLTAEFSAPLLRLFPAARILSAAEILGRLDTHLPAAHFPSLRARRLEFPLLRKLLDPHAGLTGWRLLIDSDLLFFRRPAILLDWHDRPAIPLRAEDIANAYGYPLELLAELAGRPVAERINTGLLGLRSEEVDWERLEFWCRTLLERGGPQYYQEQALVALLLAGRECVVPPPADYVLLPQPPEALECRAVMHHYVAHSKRWYFQHGWRHVSSPSFNPA